jgi:phenylalanyl-tRNA synthetase beta subunit
MRWEIKKNCIRILQGKRQLGSIILKWILNWIGLISLRTGFNSGLLWTRQLTLDSIKGGKFVEQLSDYQVFKKDSSLVLDRYASLKRFYETCSSTCEVLWCSFILVQRFFYQYVQRYSFIIQWPVTLLRMVCLVHKC